MAFIRGLDQISTKWSEVTPMRSADYAAGVSAPRRSWCTATKAAESSYEAGVTKSIGKKMFGKGVTKAGDEKWSRKATTRGVANWGPGVADAKGDYAAGFAPYHAAISACVLPPRYARRDPRNMARCKAICDALIAKKESVGGT